ncbi:MAG: HAD-IC family P-type ATPase, partial [Ruminococcus sp.]|nr:HAD-IC family P-type ATPase [Ruminococcus sp.]
AVAECSVFGRVTPQQKKQMVQALQSQKHTVAMTGDGVNDVLALKEADCSIAMAAGSDAAKNIANVVLLDSNFGAMPHIVNQGRRVVNNIRSAASMFLIKTIFSVLLSLITIFFGDAYPFEPIQMSLISACAVGIPTFLLTQENNYNKIDHTFLRHVFMNAFPAAVTITGCVFTIMLVCQDVYHSNVMLNTACVLVTGWNYMSALRTVYSPLNTYRKVIIYGMQFAFFISAVVLQDLLTLGSLEFGMIILVFVLMTFSPILIETITEWIRRIYEKSLDREDENKGFFARFLERVQK